MVFQMGLQMQSSGALHLQLDRYTIALYYPMKAEVFDLNKLVFGHYVSSLILFFNL